MEQSLERPDCLGIRKDLKSHMYNYDNKLTRFLTPTLIQNIWQNHNIGDLPGFQNYGQEEIDTIKHHYLQVLSIVIFSKWPLLNEFSTVFVQNALSDERLFFTKEDLSPMRTGIDEFLSHQYAFKPTTIIQQCTPGFVQDVPQLHRLPFIDQSDLDYGAFGVVTKRSIAPECLKVSTEDDTPKYNKEVRIKWKSMDMF